VGSLTTNVNARQHDTCVSGGRGEVVAGRLKGECNKPKRGLEFNAWP
jgi:hypothetical protein